MPKEMKQTIWKIETGVAAILFLIPQSLFGFFYSQSNNPDSKKFFLLLMSIGAICLALFLFIIHIINKKRKGSISKDSFHCEIEYDQLINTLETIQKDYISHTDINHPNIVTLSSEISDMLFTFKNHIEKMKQKAILGKELLPSESITGTQFIPTLLQKMGKLRSEALNTAQKDFSEQTNMAEAIKLMNVAIETTLPLIKRIILATEEYEADIITKIFTKFEEIWDYSKTLVGDSEQTLLFFSRDNGQDEQGLAYIAQKNIEVTELFASLSQNIEELEKNAQTFLESSINGLSTIRETISGIEEMSEKVKIISINVRIEAARESGKNSGFKVLGQEITSFAEQASKFSSNTITEVEETIKNIQPLKNQLLENLNQVREGIGIVTNKMAPYKGIIEQSYTQMDSVIKNLNEISVNILNKMKQTIGDMQYHDITNQEAIHIVEILEQMKSTCDSFSKESLPSINLEEKTIRQVQVETLEKAKSLITTGRERDILNELLSGIGIEDKKIEENAVLSGSTNLDEQTILF